MNSCINENLPYVQNLISVYGKKSSNEILAYLMTTDFSSWYGKELEYPDIKNHIITNINGDTLDIRDKIIITYNNYLSHLSNNNVSESVLDKFFSKKGQDRLILSGNLENMTKQELINSVIKESIDTIKLKANKTYDEQQLLNSKIPIEKFFGLNSNYKYIPDNKFNTSDHLFEVYHKLKLYANKKYLPLLDFLINHTNNVNITFSKISSSKKETKMTYMMTFDFAALYKPIPEDNSAIIVINEKGIKRNNKIKGELKYDDVLNDILIHELLHEYIDYRFFIDDDFKNKIEKIHNYILSNLSNEEKEIYLYYVDNPRELITYMFSNNDVKLILSRVKSFNNNSALDELAKEIRKAVTIKDKSIVDDILLESLDTIKLRNEYNSDFYKIIKLKRDIITTYRQIDDNTLLPILKSIESDWLSYKLNNKSFDKYKEDLLKTLKNCV